MKNQNLEDNTIKEVNPVNKPHETKLDDIFDNILYEKPKLDDPGLLLRKITLEESLVIISLIRHTQKSFAMDSMLREQIMAYLMKTIDSYQNWGLTINSLLVRTGLEF